MKPKSQSISYFEVSPSKRRAVHKKSLSLSAVPESSSVNSSSSTRFLSSDKNEAEEVDVHGASRPTDVISGDSPDVLISSEWYDHDPESSGQDDTTFPDTVSSSAYEKRQQKAADNWAEVRVQLLRASVETGIPSPCSVCAECEEPAVAICRDCGPQAYYCANHVDSVHSLTNIFHRPFLWKVCTNQTYCCTFVIIKCMRSDFTEWNASPILFQAVENLSSTSLLLYNLHKRSCLS